MYSTNIDGEIIEFGTSGLLYRSNKLMYDRKTGTLWNQFLGRPAVGPLVGSDIQLEILPVVVTTWGEWMAEHPDTTVLDLDTGIYRREQYSPEWEPFSIYYGYRVHAGTMFPVWEQDEQLPTKEQLLGLRINGDAKAYPLNVLKQEPVINDTVAGQNLVVISSSSGGARAYQRGEHHFTLSDLPMDSAGIPGLVDESGVSWSVQEDTLVNTEDPAIRLERLPSHNAYWFGWYAFFPDTEVYGQ